MPRQKICLRLAQALALALLPPLASCQGYWVVYPSSCPSVCSPAAANSSSYSACQGECNNCLLGWGCYSSFYPYFGLTNNTLVFTTSSCSCYWPWWAILLLVVGLAFIICVLCPVLVMCFWRKKKDQGPPPAHGYTAQGPPAAPYSTATVPDAPYAHTGAPPA